ncbi:nuclear transport factor 2 family protein [Mucilaginibacter sp. RB4R14]|uniref:nuclear transport factor 2 family protein n=1 Tax=Mucilaginibacter aurantiaciroseus TaxID=2949308 RepID=UPI0020911176|nr:nuclear transport factor 2 family protein [Mucilaginibacter aurantiaciroseus]MCO5936456.1 nuclear transport factor 2 family protein [Mucilaginibacter aurantiaciroseus]
MKKTEQIIRDYVNAYNNFDIDGMLKDIDPSILFKNISGGKTDMTLNGIDELRQQALQAKNLFSSRNQTITSIKYADNEATFEIDYHAVLAIDLPNGLKSGSELNLKGRSEFKFAGDKIIEITDIS